MAEPQIRFDDGLSYERYMGDWSRRVGSVFLDWLAAPASLKWIDVGCGNGAFTELLVERCAPTLVNGIDPIGGSTRLCARGAVGYGKLSEADKEFLKSFDRKADRKMYGERAVGWDPKVTSNARLEGDDDIDD